jgi:hypothetical protein
MAFPSSNWFRKLLEDSLENTSAIDLNSDVIKCALFTDAITGTFNFDTNLAYESAPWNASEVSGTGYTAGGATLATPGVAISSGVVAFDAADASWSTSTITARGGLVYDSTTSSVAIAAVNFGADFSSTAGTFTVQWHASGIFTIS